MSNSSLKIYIIFIFFVLFICGCATHEKKVENNKPKTPNETVFLPDIGQLDENLRGIAAKSITISNIQESGILVASVKCREDNLCNKDAYGAQRGLEIDILKRISMLIGVKLNISGGADASIFGSGTEPDKNVIQVSYPYFYSEKEGWLYFTISGDQAFADTISGIIKHLYETGTYQQMYKNNFKQNMTQ